MWRSMGVAMKSWRTSDRRPVLRLPSTPLERFLLFVALVGVVCCVVPLTLTWSELPQIVPSHFDASGRPNAYGSKSWLLLLPALSVIFTAAFTILARYPHLFNYPVRVTPENAPRLYRSGRLLLRWMNVALTWVFAFIEWQTLQVALGKATGLPTWFLPVMVGLVVLVPLTVVAFSVAWVLKR
ncbi:MAG: DUF1648 domain-containing protein [Ktedonobacterales bacterium]